MLVTFLINEFIRRLTLVTLVLITTPLASIHTVFTRHANIFIVSGRNYVILIKTVHAGTITTIRFWY